MADDEQLLAQESTVPIVCSAEPSGTAVRSAHFLLPRAEADGANLPALPSPPRNAGPILDEGLKVVFKGWPESLNLWRKWVVKLRDWHNPLWRNLGILDGVLATTCRVHRDEGALLQLAAIWSGETNTFLFPWGEATVTLEDVAVLGGLPLLGKSVRAPLQEALRRDVGALNAVRCELYRKKNDAPTHTQWVNHFLGRPLEKEAGGGDGEAAGLLEHGAFLAMWLSLFVLPGSPFDVLRAEVLPIAAQLARGGCVALAPAVLASIYSGLSLLNRSINSGKRNQPLTVWAPMQILQLWVWTRFPELRPETAPARPDRPVGHQPWATRWHNVHKVLDRRYVHAVFMSPAEFEWRPYGNSSFAPPPQQSSSWVRGRDIARSNLLQSFAQSLRACELVGMRCVEHYRPHRVARQLGFDQGVPGSVARVTSSNWEAAWATYKMEPAKFAFVVPGYKMDVTIEYAKWWEPYSSACAAAVVNAAKWKELHGLVSPRKKKMEVLHDADSSVKHPGVPFSDTLQDSPIEIPLAERLIGKTTSSSLREPIAQVRPVSAGNNGCSSSTLKQVSRLAAVRSRIAPRQEAATITDATTVQPSVNQFREEMQARLVAGEIDDRDKVDKENLPATEGSEKANEDIPASNKELDPLMEDRLVRKSQGNNKSPSCSPRDANTEPAKRVACTETLYYLRPFGRVKDAQDKGASGTNMDQGAFQPRREVGTREMIQEATAAREARKVELRKRIDRLKQDLETKEMQLKDMRS